MLENVTRLHIEKNPDIASLQDLALMPNLESLIIAGCRVEQLQPVTQLKKLTELILPRNRITDVSPLSMMTGLERLDLSGNPITTVPSLSALQNLVWLSLDNTKITDLEFLQDSALVALHINYTEVKSFAPLADCEKLECMTMYGYLDMDMTPLHQLPNFHSIYVSEGFDHTELDFLVGRFRLADNYTKVYLVLKNRGLKVNG
jgi:internalin A